MRPGIASLRRLTCLFAAAALALSACSAGDGGKPGQVVLRLSGYAGNPVETNLVAKLVEEFNLRNPDVRVKYEPVPDPYEPKILTMLVSRTAPDVFYLQSLFAQAFERKHVLLPLEPLMAADHVATGDFLPSLMTSFTDGPTVFGIPKDFNTLGLFYDRQAFDAAHLPYPDASWTYARLRDVALKLTAPDRAGFVYPIDNIDRYMPIAWSFGAQVTDAEGARSGMTPHYVLNQRPGVRALQYYADLKLKDHCAIYPGEVGSRDQMDAFGKGKAAMVMDGSWAIPYLQETYPQRRWGLAELPSGPAGKSNFLFTVAYAIPKDCKHPKEAWRLVKYLTSPEAQAQVTFAVPSRVAAARRFVAAHPEYAPIVAGADYARPYAFGVRGNAVKDRLGVAVQQVFLAGVSPQKALDDAASDVDAVNGL